MDPNIINSRSGTLKFYIRLCIMGCGAAQGQPTADGCALFENCTCKPSSLEPDWYDLVSGINDAS